MFLEENLPGFFSISTGQKKQSDDFGSAVSYVNLAVYSLILSTNLYFVCQFSNLRPSELLFLCEREKWVGPDH